MTLDLFTKDKHEIGMPFPNLPHFLDTDGTKVTQALAIHYYIADKYMPELLGTTLKEKGMLLMV